ncbi:MAG TPA: hypothetical protein VFX20_18170 [Steroidobacteraceae bacterium]|nr:hypothetical protein [Steroidobacteraceae bacterium]
MLTGTEARALEELRAVLRARRKEVNRARYVRRMRRIYPRWGFGVTRTEDVREHFRAFGVVVSRLA